MKLNQFGRAALALCTLTALRLDAGVGTLTADAYVSSASPTVNFGSAPLLNVGNGNSALLQFDLSGILSQFVSPIPNTATPLIGKATLKVYVNKAAVSGTLYAAALTAPWSEGTVSLNTLPPQSQTFQASVPVTASNQYVQLDVTPIVSGWLNGSTDTSSPGYVNGGNFGLILSADAHGVFTLDSKESTTTGHTAELNIEVAPGFSGLFKKAMGPGETPGSNNIQLFAVNFVDGGFNGMSVTVSYTIRVVYDGTSTVMETGRISYIMSTHSAAVLTSNALFSGHSLGAGGFELAEGNKRIFGVVEFPPAGNITANEIYYRIENNSGVPIEFR